MLREALHAIALHLRRHWQSRFPLLLGTYQLESVFPEGRRLLSRCCCIPVCRENIAGGFSAGCHEDVFFLVLIRGYLNFCEWWRENSRCVFMYDCCKHILLIFKVMESLPQSQPFHPLSFIIHLNILHHTPSWQLSSQNTWLSTIYFLLSVQIFTFALFFCFWPELTHNVDPQCFSHLPKCVTPSLPEQPLRNPSNHISPPLFLFLQFHTRPCVTAISWPWSQAS